MGGATAFPIVSTGVKSIATGIRLEFPPKRFCKLVLIRHTMEHVVLDREGSGIESGNRTLMGVPLDHYAIVTNDCPVAVMKADWRICVK
jgi:hypothetical protein